MWKVCEIGWKSKPRCRMSSGHEWKGSKSGESCMIIINGLYETLLRQMSLLVRWSISYEEVSLKNPMLDVLTSIKITMLLSQCCKNVWYPAKLEGVYLQKGYKFSWRWYLTALKKTGEEDLECGEGRYGLEGKRVSARERRVREGEMREACS